MAGLGRRLSRCGFGGGRGDGRPCHQKARRRADGAVCLSVAQENDSERAVRTAIASKADKAAGKVQNAVGGLKDAVRSK